MPERWVIAAQRAAVHRKVKYVISNKLSQYSFTPVTLPIVENALHHVNRLMNVKNIIAQKIGFPEQGHALQQTLSVVHQTTVLVKATMVAQTSSPAPVVLKTMSRVNVPKCKVPPLANAKLILRKEILHVKTLTKLTALVV
jgi:hypothetical protein